MKVWKMIYCLLLIALCGCSVRQREKELEARTNELNQKEQELLLKEKTLQLKEEELKSWESRIDSSKHQAVAEAGGTYDSSITGTWLVNMQCTETSCEGSAVGDTKSEHWLISYVDSNSVIAKAMAGNKLVRVYSGKYMDNVLQLTAEQQDITNGRATKILVRLQPGSANEMNGSREILRESDCKIIYSLTLKRTQTS